MRDPIKTIDDTSMKNIDYVKMGRLIRRRRLELEWTQEYLAERSGISPSFLGLVERGERFPSMETLMSLTNALGITPNHVLRDSIWPECLDMGKQIRSMMESIAFIINTKIEHMEGALRDQDSGAKNTSPANQDIRQKITDTTPSGQHDQTDGIPRAWGG